MKFMSIFLFLRAKVILQDSFQIPIMNIFEKCIPNEKYFDIHFVYENISSDEAWQRLFVIFRENQNRVLSNKW